jgi:hypothetical protein
MFFSIFAEAKKNFAEVFIQQSQIPGGAAIKK